MKYIDVVPGKSDEFYRDFIDVLLEDIILKAREHELPITQMWLEGILSSVVDSVNLIIYHCRKKNLRLAFMRIEMEFLYGGSLKLSFKPLDNEQNLLLDEKDYGRELILFPTKEDVKNLQKNPGRGEITAFDVPLEKPSEN